MSANHEKEELQTIDVVHVVHQFFNALRRYWVMVLVLTVLLAAVNGIRTYRSFRPMYEAKAQFTVNSGYTSDDIFNSTYYNNMAAQQLAEAFPSMLHMELMKDLMKQQLGKNSINGTITAQAVAETNLFILTVRSSSPEDAHDILCAVIDCYPQVAVYVVDNPQVIIRREPTVPAQPYNAFSWTGPLIKGGIVGFALGMGALLVLAFLRKTVSTVDELKKLINLPVLAIFPQIQFKKRRQEKQMILVTNTPALEEPLHGLRLKVDKLLEGQTRKVILVTSTLSGEGKTTVAANLAMGLTSGGKRVVLVDADLRSQSVAECFGREPGSVGLMECLKNPERSVMDHLTHASQTLSYLSGPSTENLRYSIDARAMRKLLTELLENYDYVVLDTAPCGLVSDTALMCHYADHVLYVVRPDCASQTQIFDAVDELYNRGVRLAGVVFNNVPVSHSHYGYKYGYGYGYKYGYGYGYGYGKKQKKKEE